MTSLLPISPSHPEPVDPGQAANAPVTLYAGPLTAKWPDPEEVRHALPGWPEERVGVLVDRFTGGVAGFGKVQLALSPTPHINWLFCEVNPSIEWPIRLLPVLNLPTTIPSGFATRSSTKLTLDPSFPFSVSTGVRQMSYYPQIGAPNQFMDEIKFYLVNFQVFFLVDDVQHQQIGGKKGRLILKWNGWQIDIDCRSDFGSSVMHIEHTKGYALTHNCSIRREDNAQFTFNEASDVLEAVKLLTSFIRGGLVGIALPVGYKDSLSIFEEWSVTATDPGHHNDQYDIFPGWYVYYDDPRLNRDAAIWLPGLFGQFSMKWWNSDTKNENFWRKALQGIIYSYLDAERFEESRSIVPACTALETLSWAILVIMAKWLNQEGYDKLTAGDQLRLLLRWAGISTEVPASLHKLAQKAGDKYDGPQVVTWVRNRIVHPDRRDQLTDGIAEEARTLAMWYVELALLKLLGYDGYFRDRLDGRRIKRMPWAAV